MACGECDRLRRENRELREEIEEWRSGVDLGEDYVRLASIVPMNPQCSRIIVRMMQNPGHVVLSGELIETMHYRGEDRDLPDGNTSSGRALMVIMSLSRRALERVGVNDALVNFRGLGYYITKDAATKVRALL